jgi:hypothetical protein
MEGTPHPYADNFIPVIPMEDDLLLLQATTGAL